MKTKHGILALLVALCLLIGLLPGTVLAASTVASGTSGGNITWVLDSDGVLTISGESDIGEAPTWIFYGYAEKVKTVIIEEGITGIGFSAFDGCTNLSSISIPNTVTYIDGQAFAHCSSLTNITIPESVTSIWGNSFLGCSSLTSIVIPASVTSVASGAFLGCTSLTAIEVDSDNEAYCSQDGVLFNKDMTELIACPSGKTGAYVIPTSVTSVGSSAFSGCTGLTSISIPDGVISIGSASFSGCTGLTSISIPDGVTSIGSYAFSGCTGLTSISIPASVTSIETSAFAYCANLTAIDVDSNNANYSSQDGVLFNKDMTELLLYPNAKAGAYVIPDGITDIGTVFSGHEYLTAISIPDSVTSIRARAFDGCTGLESIIVSESNTDYCSVDGVLFSKDLTELLIYPDGKSGEYAIPDGTLIINDYAFSGCTKLTGVTIPNSVKGLYVYAFSGCTGLTSVTIGSGISIIGSSAFEGCTGLTSVSIPDSVTSIYSAAFKDCTSLTSIVIPDSVTVIGNMAFYGCTGLTSVSIPDSVTKIYGSAFVGCSNLAEINVDADNEIYCSLDGVLFNKDMTELIEYPAGKAGAYTVPDSVTDIGYVFCDNTALTSITLGKCAANVTISSFSGCANLQAIYVDGENEDYCSVDGVLFSKDMTTLIRYPYAKAGDYTIPEGVTSIGSSAFFGCTGLTGVTIPDSVTSIGVSAFHNCVNLAYVTLPDSITEIAPQTFYNCDSLTCITIPASVTYLGFNAFTFCDNLKTIIFTGNAPETYCPFSELNEMSYGIVNITATAYYPAGDETWTEEAMESAYGDITWVAYTPGETADAVVSVAAGEGAPTTDVNVPLTSEDMTLGGIGVEVSYVLNVNAVESVSEEEKALIEAALDGNTAAMYLDVTLNRTVGGDTAAVTETEEMVTITFTIPEELLGENRTYSVIRVHDGEAEVLPDLDEDANTVTIQTDRFSTYVLTYSETANEPTAPATSEPEASTPTGDNPKDGDFAPIMTCAVLMLLSAAAVVTMRKRVF